MNALLELQHMSVDVVARRGTRRLIRDVSLSVEAGEAVGLIGESGSGKSLTARAILRALPPGAVRTGEVHYGGRPVDRFGGSDLRRFRYEDVGMVFQDPRAHINPVRTVGDFITEAMRTLGGLSRQAAEERAVEILAATGVPEPWTRLKQYPHQLSGGLLQRVMIAAAFAPSPRLLIADEPTTALDVTTQEEVVAILDRQRRERGMSMLFVTHDLDLASALCDRLAVMYAGSIVEILPAKDLTRARHPYTQALMAARPRPLEFGERLPAIPGTAIAAYDVAAGCSFADRCLFAQDVCRSQPPVLSPIDGGMAACHRSAEGLAWDEMAEASR